MKQVIVTASELSEYIYCQRAWWLRMKGLLKTNTAMLAGTQKHDQLASFLQAFSWKLLFAFIIFCLGLLGIAVYILSLLFK